MCFFKSAAKIHKKNGSSKQIMAFIFILISYPALLLFAYAFLMDGIHDLTD